MKNVSMYEVEDWLPEDMKRLKRAALAGDTDAEFNLGLIYGDLANKMNDDNITNIGARWLARAAKKGHAGAINCFSSAGVNWRNYDY